MQHIYLDRVDAGQQLTQLLGQYHNAANTIVLALPRGGVPVANEIARQLKLPLDVIIVRKIGAPFHVEYAIGAIASGGVLLLNDQAIRDLDVSDEVLEDIIAEEQAELSRREHLYRANKPKLNIPNQTIILVDDGIATGFTMKAAVLALKKSQPKRLIVAVPVASMEAIKALKPLVDELICPEIPEHFYAVGAWYKNFNQTTDQQVTDILSTLK